jgi:hypothetical protein
MLEVGKYDARLHAAHDAPLGDAAV